MHRIHHTYLYIVCLFTFFSSIFHLTTLVQNLSSLGPHLLHFIAQMNEMAITIEVQQDVQKCVQ
jgi:hypothetical protein